MSPFEDIEQLGRRAFLRNGTLFLTAAASTNISHLFAVEQLAAENPSTVTIGLLTDLHYADKAPAGMRHYRETLAKLSEAALEFEKVKPDFIVELGDLIDAADAVSVELGYLKTINREFAEISPQRHYVLGNHCVDTLTKEEFLGEVGQKKSYYSFEQGELHCIVLDACFRGDGTPYQRKNFTWTDSNIPAVELEWLRDDLQMSGKNTIVFAHQRLDVSNNHGVKNCKEVRQVLEESGQVLAVFQGHSHRNDHTEIGGIHYCTLVAMVEGSGAENSGYSILNVLPDGTLKLTGFRQQSHYTL